MRTKGFIFHPVLLLMFIFVISALLLISVCPRSVMAQSNTGSKVVVSGLVEVNAQYSSWDPDEATADKVKESDITISTAEIGIDAQIHPSVSGHVLLLWEEDESTEVADILDEATITISNPGKCPYYLTAGKMYLPFGNFESSFVTDSMTLELGEINQTAIEIGYEKDLANFSLGFFNGDVEKTDKDNEINNFFAQLEINYSQDPYYLTFGASYISDMLDSDGMEALVETGEDDDLYDVKDFVQGMGIFLKINTDKAFLIAEYVSAIDDIDDDLIEDYTLFEKSCKPSSYNIELGMKTPQNGLLALKYEASKDTEALDLPEKRYGIVYSHPLFDIASVSLEYIHEKYTDVEEEGKNNIFTVQLAIEF